MKTVDSKILGKLTQDERFEDWWHSETLKIPLVDKELVVTFMDFEPDSDETFIQEADTALRSFLLLDSVYRAEISNLVLNHFVEYKELVCEVDVPTEMKEINEHEIWKFITPTEILITRRPYNEPDIFINLTCECAWEPEHGLQLVFKKGKALTRVSSQDGHLTTADAYDIPDSEDELLAKFKE
ncbi:DUF6985 domain-containing protein [Marinifilum caeruleilacunae]|uniref:DUF6985 domain-containing protein n=1 Tax=Marinifilum caeruleilacunae TaxID=2499076 RepID=A0ABX1X191_9BACT|nr:hypothetical protein [Marinifilum caeruleilacunae]NOU61986.1 hypothetical protein [Marinifilum caeruleilacunae]